MRKFALAGSLCVALVALGSVAAVAATVAQTPPARVRAHVQPPHILAPPFTWHIFGTIVPPKLLCPAGVTNPRYCETPPSNVCVGKVTIRMRLGPDPFLKKGGETVAFFKTNVGANCSFDVTHTLPDKDLTALTHIANGAIPGRFDGVFTVVTFDGNQFLTPETANTQITIVKLVNVP